MKSFKESHLDTPLPERIILPYKTDPVLMCDGVGNSLISEIFRGIPAWKGRDLRVVIRPCSRHEKCPVTGCGEIFSDQNNLSCKIHKTFPHRVYIDITGRKIDGGRLRITKSVDGVPLQILSAISLKNEIAYKISKNIFNPRQYMDNGRRLLFRNYKHKYLEKMRERADRSSKSDGWLAGSSLDDIVKYHRNYLAIFDNYQIYDIDARLVEKELDGLKMASDSNRLAGATIKAKIIGHLRHLLGYAVKQGDILSIPDLPSIELDKREVTVLSKQQQREILDHVPVSADRLILEWATESGRRENEYRAFKLKDINFERKTYMVGGAFDKETYKEFPKKRRTAFATFPLTSRQVEIVHQAISGRVCGPDDFVFVNIKGKHYKEREIRDIFNAARKATGYKVTLNEFGRHSFAVQLLEAGASYAEVAVMLNNDAQTVEKFYATWSIATKAKILSMRENLSSPVIKAKSN